MSHLRIKYSYFLLLIAFSVSIQFDYLFFNIPFLPPFLAVASVSLVVIALPTKSLTDLVIFLFSISLLFLFAFLAGVYDVSELRRTLLYPGYIVLFVFVVNRLLYKVSLAQLSKAIKLTLLLCIIAVLLETFFRFYMPTLDLRSDVGGYILGVANEQSGYEGFLSNKYYYAFKFSSIMFFDSNFVGLFLLPLLVLNLFCLRFYRWKKLLRFQLAVILILVLLTFSRAAIITSVLILYSNFMYRLLIKNRELFLAFLFFSLLFGFIALANFLEFLLSDGSFGTKLNIITSISSIVDHDLIHILFGYGVDGGGTIYSYKDGAYAHALIPLLLGQFGVLGLTIYLVFLAYYSNKVGFFGWLLFFSIFVSGFSLADPWQVLNYLALLAMAHFKNKLSS